MLRGLLICWLAVSAIPAAAADPAPGRYRLTGEQDVASEIVLGKDGRFAYFLAAGALDERSEGRWSAKDGLVTLATEPKPVPPVFTAGPPGRSEEAPLTVKVVWPDGRGIAGVDFRIGFAEGEPRYDYTQEDGWSLPADETRTPLWVELAVPMHELGPARFPIDLAAGNALTFTLTPNDMGVLDMSGLRVEAKGRRLIVQRAGGSLTYERLKGR